MKITIGGMPGSGKSVVGRFIAEQLGYGFYSIGSIRRGLAEKRGMTINDYNALDEDTDKEVDDFQKKLGREEDNFVVEGRLSYHFIPDSLKIYFDCDLKVAAERIFKASRSTEGKGGSPEDIHERLKERIQSDCDRYERHYGLDCYDKGQFDYVIDTTGLSLDEVKSEVLEVVKERLG